ncbi:MAG: hypothetical protein IKR38_04190 [Bacteroidales bacterium]|nr:hypothetical protein [Bacteroidales bacterium]
MKKWFLFFVLATFAVSASGQDSFKFLVEGHGKTIKEAADAAFEGAISLCRTLVPDTVSVNFAPAVAGRKVIRSGFSGGAASSTLLVSFSMDKVSALLQDNGLNVKGLQKKALRLQRDNTAAAFGSLLTELEALAPGIMDGKVSFSSDDGFTESATALVTWRTNGNTARFCSILDVTLNALSLTEEEGYAAAGLGLMTYNIAYFLNTPEYNIKEGTTIIKRNIRHYSKDLFDGFTYEDNFHRELFFLAPLDIKRLKRIFLQAVNAYKIKDDSGHLFVTNLREDFMDVLFVDDFAKAVTNIDLWNVPLSTKFTFEDKWGPSAFQLGSCVALFLLPKDDSRTIYQVRYSPDTYSYYSLEPVVD